MWPKIFFLSWHGPLVLFSCFANIRGMRERYYAPTTNETCFNRDLINAVYFKVSTWNTKRASSVSWQHWPFNMGQFTWGPQVPLMSASPNMKAKSQLLSLKKPLKCGLHPLNPNIDIFNVCKTLAGLVLRVGSKYILNPTVNTSPRSHL
jgi:hypothetical protein